MLFNLQPPWFCLSELAPLRPGDIAQQQRERTLKRFRDGRFSVLVATDVAARGMAVQVNISLTLG